MEEKTSRLASQVIARGAIPAKAGTDAVHLAVAVVHGVDYLVTWNLKHLVNAQIRRKINEVCASAGYSPIVICTPEELIGEEE